MGICSSCEATTVATAKLILQDGRLQEFSYPVKVSHVLRRDPNSFICNSDEMDFDDVVSAVEDDEVLQPGQLYFALPLSRLKHRLQAEEMAALAVKASSALMKNGAATTDLCRGCNRNSVPHNTHYSAEDKEDSAARRGGARSERSSGGRSRDRGRRQNFTVMLSAIPE